MNNFIYYTILINYFGVSFFHFYAAAHDMHVALMAYKFYCVKRVLYSFSLLYRIALDRLLFNGVYFPLLPFTAAPSDAVNMAASSSSARPCSLYVLF